MDARKSPKREPLRPFARAAVSAALSRVLQAGMPADRAMAEALRPLKWMESAERHQVHQKLMGTLSALARLSWWLARIGIERNAPNLLAAHDVFFRGVAPRAAIKDWAEEPKRGGKPKGAGSGALSLIEGAELHHKDMDELTLLEVPPAYAPFLRKAFGEAFAFEMKGLAAKPDHHLRANTLKSTVSDVSQVLESQGVVTRPTALSPLGLKVVRGPDPAETQAFKDGWFETQDEGSQLAALILNAKPGERTLDLCAGAGGKTLVLAAEMANKGQVVAADTNAGRLKRARTRAARAGAFNIDFRLLDDEGKKWLAKQRFDAVLVDAPCTGTGAWRRNPEAKWTKPDPGLKSLTAEQDALLAEAAKVLKPKGRIVYVTCSVLQEENEERIDAFLAAHRDFALAPAKDAWPKSCAAPYPGGPDPILRLTPARHGTDGFCVAVLRRHEIAATRPKTPPQSEG